jgi:hypothetical protein
MSAILRIEYTGAEPSALLETDAAAQTITSRIGALGSESADPAFGTAGTLDLSGFDTLDEVAAEVDGYVDYTAELALGDETTAAAGLVDTTVYAKPDAAHLYFDSSVALQPYALVTWATAKARLGLVDADQDQTVFLINSASRKANDYARRHLAAADYVVRLDGSGRPTLVLPQYPVNSITDVRIDPDRGFGVDTVVTDYVSYDSVGVLYRTSGRWPRGRQVIQVTYNAGYSHVPEDLQEAVLEAVAWSLRRIASNQIGTRSLSGDGMTAEYELTIPTNAQRVFESYRDWRFA